MQSPASLTGESPSLSDGYYSGNDMTSLGTTSPYETPSTSPIVKSPRSFSSPFTKAQFTFSYPSVFTPLSLDTGELSPISPLNDTNEYVIEGTQKLTPLELPELLYLILQFLGVSRSLYPALFVNREWHDAASGILWRNIYFEGKKDDIERFGQFVTLLEGASAQREKENIEVLTMEIDANVAQELSNNSMPPSPSNQVLAERRSRRRTILKRHRNTPVVGPPAKTSLRSVGISLSPPSSPLLSPRFLRQFNPFGSTAVDLSINDLRISSPTPRIPSHLTAYQTYIRSLTVRKIKEKTVDAQLDIIARSSPNLRYLDIYICDHLTDATVQSFVTSYLHHAATTQSMLTHISLAGCHRITDAPIIAISIHCPQLEHLDLRACGQVSDVSISSIAMHCPKLKHLNVGRIHDRDRITISSIELVAMKTEVSVLGLAGCDITDECMILLAKHRNLGLERISVNNCHRLTNETIRAFVRYCRRLSVFEMKDCHLINDWESVAELVSRKVLLTLCEEQNKACVEWARSKGKMMKVRAPVK